MFCLSWNKLCRLPIDLVFILSDVFDSRFLLAALHQEIYKYKNNFKFCYTKSKLLFLVRIKTNSVYTNVHRTEIFVMISSQCSTQNEHHLRKFLWYRFLDLNHKHRWFGNNKGVGGEVQDMVGQLKKSLKKVQFNLWRIKCTCVGGWYNYYKQ